MNDKKATVESLTKALEPVQGAIDSVNASIQAKQQADAAAAAAAQAAPQARSQSAARTSSGAPRQVLVVGLLIVRQHRIRIRVRSTGINTLLTGKHIMNYIEHLINVDISIAVALDGIPMEHQMVTVM